MSDRDTRDAAFGDDEIEILTNLANNKYPPSAILGVKDTAPKKGRKKPKNKGPARIAGT